MTETTLTIIFILKLLLLVVFAACYTIGGRKGTPKAIRRILGSALLGAGIIGFSIWQRSYSVWYYTYPILLFAALSCGYGGDTIWDKIKRRSIYGCCLALSAAPIAIVNGAWTLWGFQAVLCLGASLVFGLRNPISAVSEEGLIGLMSVLLVPFMLR